LAIPLSSASTMMWTSSWSRVATLAMRGRDGGVECDCAEQPDGAVAGLPVDSYSIGDHGATAHFARELSLLIASLKSWDY
jgi:hypothetical protein